MTYVDELEVLIDIATMANPNLPMAGPIVRPPDSSIADASMMLGPQFDHATAFMSDVGFSEVFDSLNWVFDGIPESFVAPPVI